MSNHLKRLNMPRTWKLERKGFKFMIRPDAGKNSDLSIPLLPVLRDMLKVVSSAKECRFVINQGLIKVNQVPAKRAQQTLGLFDVLSVKDEDYRLKINEKNQLFLDKAKDGKHMISKVINKRILKKGKVQLNLMNGYNVLVPKDDYQVGDSVELTLPKMTVKSKKSLQKGGKALIFKGRHPGLIGVVEEVTEGGITLKADNKSISTLKEYAIAI